MQNIRRATKTHRKVLMGVVILLMVGLVGSFATWNANSSSAAGPNGEMTLEQQISSYESYIATMRAEQGDNADYSACLSLASSYLDLSYMYANKHSQDEAAKAEAEAAAAAEAAETETEPEAEPEAEAEPEQSAAQIASTEAARWSFEYYRLALERAPEGLNNAAIADIKAGQAYACEVQGDQASALAYASEAHELSPENIQFLFYRASLNEALGNYAEALALYEQASIDYPDNTEIITTRASLHAMLGQGDEARALYDEARKIAPEDFNVAYGYATFLFSYETPEAGIAELKAYRDALPEGHEMIAQADNSIAYMEAMMSYFADLNIGGEETGEGEEGGAVDGEGAEGVNTEDDNNEGESTEDERK